MRKNYVAPTIRLLSADSAKLMSASDDTIQVEVSSGDYSGEFHAPKVKSLWDDDEK